MQPALRVVDLVWRVAAQAPNRTAVVAYNEAISYASLLRRIGCVARGLSELGVRPGQTVAVGSANLFLHLLLLAALDQCGVLTGSFHSDESFGHEELLAAADLVLTDRHEPPSPARRHLTLDADWFANVCAGEPLAAVAPLTADDAMMIIRSSGTTGRPKRLLLTRAMLAARCRQRISAYGMDADTRYLLTMGPSVHTIVAGVVLTWQLGGMVVREQRLPLWQAFAAARPTHATLLPLQLGNLLAALPPEFARLPELRLIVLGGRLPPGLRAAALERLAGEIVDHYGANEAGLICRLSADATGMPVPGLTVAILGDDGTPVALGQTGRVAVRGDSVAAGYLDEPALTARHFRAGWFLTDDLAEAASDGGLRLIGRAGEVLNLGGHKVACEDIEDQLRRHAQLVDVAVIGGDDYAASLVIVCVLHPGDTREQAASRIGQCGKELPAGTQVRAASALPRTPEGKLRRSQLRVMLGA